MRCGTRRKLLYRNKEIVLHRGIGSLRGRDKFHVDTESTGMQRDVPDGGIATVHFIGKESYFSVFRISVFSKDILILVTPLDGCRHVDGVHGKAEGGEIVIVTIEDHTQAHGISDME